MQSKIHGAVITSKALEYNGSIGIDGHLLKASGILPGEQVQVLNFNNGKRFETYVIEEAQMSGIISLYGPAARMGEVGDKLVVISYVSLSQDEWAKFEPTMVFVDGNNKVRKL